MISLILITFIVLISKKNMAVGQQIPYKKFQTLLFTLLVIIRYLGSCALELHQLGHRNFIEKKPGMTVFF